MSGSITRQSILRDLRALGVQNGMALEVHCALGSFGCVDGGADAVIAALMRAVGPEGALVMPSFRLSKDLPLDARDRELGITLKIRIFDSDVPVSGMGAVGDAFRALPDVATGEGVLRVSAWGKNKELHAQGFQRLIDMDGYVLLMGVDIYKLSSMHYVEDALPEAIKRRFAPSAAARERYPEQMWWIESWTPEAKPWHEIQRRARERGFIRDGWIGGSKCMLLKVNDVIGLYGVPAPEVHEGYDLCFAGTEDVESWMCQVELVGNGFPGLVIDAYRGMLLRNIARQSAICVKRNDEVVGVLLYSIQRGTLSCMAVHPDHRRRGIASAMIERMISRFPTGRDIWVSTFREGDPRGDAPRALYKRHGFVEDELVMQFAHPNQRFVRRLANGRH